MHYDPKCKSNKHKCTEVCVSVMCRTNNPFVCISCENPHKQQTCEVIPYKKLIRQFHKIQGIYTNQMLKYEERVENTFSELMNGLRNQFVKFREEFQYVNINEKISAIYDKIKGNKENQLNGETLHWAMKTIKRPSKYIVKDQLSMRMMKTDIMDVYMQLIKKLPPYYSLSQLEKLQNYPDMQNPIKDIQDNYMNKRNRVSGILGQHFQYLQQMLKKQIYNIHLLYRATQNNFSAQTFHKKCDGIKNTIMVAKTEYDRIIIGFCPFPWQSPNQWVYKQDTKQQCFLISPSKQLKNKKFTPFKTKFAIGMHKDYGPSFGDDFVIYDKAQHSKNCWSNFPDVYTCRDKPTEHSASTIRSFVGVRDHFEKFNLKEWEVYRISSGPNDELDNTWIQHYKTIKQQ